MRIVFVATGDIALPTWDWLMSEGKQVLALVTQPDKPVGRKQILTPPALKLRAEAAGIPVLQPESLRKKSAIDAVAALAPDLIIVMAYGQILTERFLAIPTVACINLHASLLPRFRGAACIQAAIDAGDACSGITVMHMVRALDAGDVILQKSLPLTREVTGGELHDQLADLAPQALAEVIALMEQGTAPRLPQIEEESCYVGKLLRDDGLISWDLPAEQIERRVRAYDPWPGTFAQIRGGSRLKIFPPLRIVTSSECAAGQVQMHRDGLLVGCGKDALLLADVQPEGGKRMPASVYARGLRGEMHFI